jgi:hypothetical protein
VETNTGTFCSFIFLQKPGIFSCRLLFSRSFGLATTRRGFQMHARNLVVRSLETTISTTTEFRWTAVCSRMPYPASFRSFACAAASQGGGNSWQAQRWVTTSNKSPEIISLNDQWTFALYLAQILPLTTQIFLFVCVYMCFVACYGKWNFSWCWDHC